MSNVSVYGSLDQKAPHQLIEVVSHKSSKVDKTVSVIFKEPYLELNERLEYKQTIMSKLSFVPYVSTAASISTLIAFGITLDFHVFLGFLGSIASFGFMGVSLVVNKHYGKNAELFLEDAGLITEFSNSFESFKQEPKSCKVADLFKQFEKIRKSNWYLFVVNENLLDQEQIKFFQQTGKLFLMDAVCSYLDKTEDDWQSAVHWRKTLDGTIKTKKSLRDAEPWKTLGIANVNYDCYLNFYLQRVNLSSNKIVKKIAECYELSVKKGLELNLI